MSNLNQVIISGNLGADAELRTTATNTNVLTFSVAVNENRKDANGVWETLTNWVQCTLFGERAQKMQDRLTKGAKVTVIGKLRISTYEKGGEKKTSTTVIVNNIDIHTPKAASEATEDIPF